jgi:YbbR domain-containing protein
LLKRWINDLGLMLLALVLAIVVWIVAVQDENPIMRGEFADAIPIEVRNQPTGTTFLPERFEEDVRLTIRAPQSSWRDLRADKFTAWIDLQEREAGVYEVPVYAECIDDNVRIVELAPANVPVRLRTEVSRQVQVEVRVYGSAAQGYEMRDAITDPALVTITGPESVVEQVTKATVDLDLRDRKEPFVGTRRVVARQADDGLVSFVNIEPSTVGITVPVVQEIGSNEVAVRPVITGTVASGYWVRDVSVDPQIVTLIGDPAAVREIQGYVETTPLNIDEATGDVVERMPLDLPEQVSPVGVQGVLVTVYIEAQQGTLTILREPVIRGMGANLDATVSPAEVALTLTGARSRLRALTDEDVYVYVDLVDKGIGQHSVDLTYLVPEGLEVISLLPDSVDVAIRPAPPTPTATPTATATRRPTATPTPVLTSTLTETVTITGTTGITTIVPLTVTPAPSPTVAAGTPNPTPVAEPTPAASAPTVLAPAVSALAVPAPMVTPAKEED